MHKGEHESELSERKIRHNFTIKSALIGSDFFHLRKIFNDQRSRRNFDESSSGPRDRDTSDQPRVDICCLLLMFGWKIAKKSFVSFLLLAFSFSIFTMRCEDDDQSEIV